MKPEENWQIERIYFSQFSPEILFEAWVSPKMAVLPVVRIDVEPRIGGHFVLHSRFGKEVMVMKGKFIGFVKNEELVYSWNWEGSEERSIVLVKFRLQKEGTSVHLRHTGFLTEDSMIRHVSGWDGYMTKLEIALEKKIH